MLDKLLHEHSIPIAATERLILVEWANDHSYWLGSNKLNFGLDYHTESIDEL
jgi:hypothetical protein